MAIIEVIVCDVCRNTDRGTTRFRISEDRDSRLLDLCNEHATPLRELLNLDQTEANVHLPIASRKPVAQAKTEEAEHRGRVRRGRKGFDSHVTTLAEIEVMKQSS